METNKGYLLGRLLATLDHVGAVGRHHTTAERQYETACRNPSSLIPILQSATSTGYTDIVTPIMEALNITDNPFSTAPLADEDLAEFALGYYHQRADLRAGLLPGPGNRGTRDEEPPLTEVWQIRLDADLKSWALANGGSELVRALLREERTKRERLRQK